MIPQKKCSMRKKYKKLIGNLYKKALHEGIKKRTQSKNLISQQTKSASVIDLVRLKVHDESEATNFEI